MHRENGFRVLLDAMAQISKPAPALMIVGSGSEAQPGEMYVGRPGLVNRADCELSCVGQEQGECLLEEPDHPKSFHSQRELRSDLSDGASSRCEKVVRKLSKSSHCNNLMRIYGEVIHA